MSATPNVDMKGALQQLSNESKTTSLAVASFTTTENGNASWAKAHGSQINNYQDLPGSIRPLQ